MTGKEIEKARGNLNTMRFIDMTKEQIKLYYELQCREMINSCLCYGTDFLTSRYAKDFIDKIGFDRVHELYEEQVEDFKKATLYINVHTDCEGVTYNSIKWADEI